jgi:hypothetical protein
MEIHNRSTLDGIEVDSIMYGRFFSRVLRTAEGWRLASFDGIYHKDVIAPVNPAEKVPLDWAALRSFRPSYRIWAYMMSRRGYEVTQDELGDDRPDLLSCGRAMAREGRDVSVSGCVRPCVQRVLLRAMQRERAATPVLDSTATSADMGSCAIASTM